MPEAKLRVFDPSAEEFAEGGFLDGLKAKIADASIMLDDTSSDGTPLERPKIVLALKLDGVDGHDLSKVFPPKFSLGGKSIEQFMVGNLDGTPVPKNPNGVTSGPAYLTYGNAPAANSNYGLFMESLKKCLWPREKLCPGGDHGSLIGAVVVFKQVADERFKDVPVKEGEKRYPVTLVDYVESFPWQNGALKDTPATTAATAATGTNTPKPRGRPAKTAEAAATTTAITTAPAAAPAAVAGEGNSFESILNDSIAGTIQIILLTIEGNSVEKKSLLMAINKGFTKEFADENTTDLCGLDFSKYKQKLLTLGMQDQWLKGREEFVLEGGVLSLSA